MQKAYSVLYFYFSNKQKNQYEIESIINERLFLK